jgi:hypothetical protein
MLRIVEALKGDPRRVFLRKFWGDVVVADPKSEDQTFGSTSITW